MRCRRRGFGRRLDAEVCRDLGGAARFPCVFWWQLVPRLRVAIWHFGQKAIEILEVRALGPLPEVINGLQCGKLFRRRCDQELVHGVTVFRRELLDRAMEGIGNTDG